MALAAHIEAADTGCPRALERAERQKARRDRITAKGTFRDDALLPATFHAVELTQDEIGGTFRRLFWAYAGDRDKRVLLLSALLGE